MIKCLSIRTDRTIAHDLASRRLARSVNLVILSLLTATLLAGCALFESDSNTVTARSDGLRVTIKNETGDRIYYFLVGSELATRHRLVSPSR